MSARWLALGLRQPDGRRDRGQILILFALSIVVLFSFAGLAFDIGRFYSEKRFLQNAADAAALAAANALARGATVIEARDAAKTILTRNYLSDPTGKAAALPPDVPVYASGHAGDPVYLTNGILISGGDVRVSIQNPVDWTFARIVGFQTNTVAGQARARLQADMLPIAVRHYINGPGPNVGATAPCPGDGTGFTDYMATSDTSCLGTQTNGSLRVEPSEGMAFSASTPDNDPTNHGPIQSLVGQGAAPGNAANFRGFIVLDIRDFETTTSNVFYNGVTAATGAVALKGIEAGYIVPGYPGPAFPAATTPPDPMDQVGILDGNSAGLVVDEMINRYSPGDEVTCAVYSGVVMTIPDFVFVVPPSVSIGTTQNRNSAITMLVQKNTAFAGVVTTSAHDDPGDPATPTLATTLLPLTFSPQPATPDTTITWTTFQTIGAPVGIYTKWIQGHSSSPYLTDHYYPTAINIGGVVRDFGSPTVGKTDAVSMSIASTGLTATQTVTFATTNKAATAFRGTVDLSIEGGIANGAVLPAGIGAVSVSPSSLDLQNGNPLNSQNVTLSVDGGSLAPGEYDLVIRATGTNLDGLPVTHLVPIRFDVATGSTSLNYVDIEGWAVFRIVDMQSPNFVSGYAITPLVQDPTDSRLRHGQVPKLVPWN
jgi:Putative Flp pilus-assembly TadE/G-like